MEGRGLLTDDNCKQGETMNNPFKALLLSRKFWLLILDTVVSVATFFIQKYLGGDGTDYLFVIASIQPVFVMMIGAIAYEDGKKKGATVIHQYAPMELTNDNAPDCD
jgi:predicted membrane-bound dolichyl-phosphate-mannose-protein mannosyltransferase